MTRTITNANQYVMREDQYNQKNEKINKKKQKKKKAARERNIIQSSNNNNYSVNTRNNKITSKPRPFLGLDC